MVQLSLRHAVALFALAAPVGVSTGAAGQEPTGDASGEDAFAGEEEPIEGRFLEETHGSPHGSRRYRLFVPEGGPDEPAPLLLMLHGCTQDPEDFARGTRMNEVAGGHGWLVLYPEQPAEAHPQRCWNWYLEAHQGPGSGEPALLASMVDSVAAGRAVDPERVYVAGVSAGGAMALVMAAAHPDRFAGVASHSGVPYAAGRGEASALAVMGGGGASVSELARRLRSTLGKASPPPLLVIHGMADPAVDPANAYRSVASWWLAGRGETPPPGAEADDAEALEALLPRPAVATTGTSEDGRDWSRRTWRRPDGTPALELWRVEGLGHAWSGGDPAGSYADPSGPDASHVLVDFLRRVSGDRPAVDGRDADGGGSR